MLADLVALVMLGALVAYTVTGGADFGGGVWDLLASGPRKEAQRALIAKAIAPIWEANHVWLILLVVVMFGALPTAFSALMTALHIPLVLVLVGVVLRGAAFVFRTYDPKRGGGAERWRLVFAIASVVTPLALGVSLGALVSGGIHLDSHDGIDFTQTSFTSSWATPFALGTGVFTVVLLAYLAAVYLTVEAEERALQDDFRVRALVAGVASAIVAHGLLFAGLGPRGGWGIVVEVVVALCGASALWLLWTRRYRVARIMAAAQVAGVVVGLGLAQYPYVIPPDLTFARALAPDTVVEAMLIALAVGVPILFAALVWLYRVFKEAP